MNQSGNRRLLHRRWVYRTLREVWLVDEQVVEKRFLHHPGRRDWRPLWQREHRALERLAGFDPFTFRALQCYALRLHLAWRRADLDAERGRANAARLAGLPAPEPAGVPTP